MASYKLLIKPSAVSELEALPKKDRKRIIAKIKGFTSDPRPPGSEKLTGDEKYCVRQGNYRVLYSIQDNSATVTIVKTGHQRDVYRN